MGQYLLRVSGVKFLLSERFTQDPVETFFSQQRQRGGGSENPTVHKFTYNTSSLRIQRSSTPVATSAVRPSKHHLQDEDIMDDTPLPKRLRFSKKWPAMLAKILHDMHIIQTVHTYTLTVTIFCSVAYTMLTECIITKPVCIETNLSGSPTFCRDFLSPFF